MFNSMNENEILELQDTKKHWTDRTGRVHLTMQNMLKIYINKCQ